MDYEKILGESLLPTYEQLKRGLLQLIDEGKISREDAARVLPELRESEDEKIRKWLVDYFGSIKETVWIHRDITCEQILTYLEKQEQKPAEKQDYSGLTDFERAIHRGFLVVGVENVPVAIIKETAQDCLAHMPAWSEEDEKMLNLTKRQLRILQSHLSHTHSESMSDMEYSSRLLQIDVCVSWLDIRLKSLRPQSKQEWSKEDEEMTRKIDCYLSSAIGVSEEERLNIEKWLKSLRPSWKPSEEQMKALNKVVNGEVLLTTQHKSLESLYEQLKKL